MELEAAKMIGAGFCGNRFSWCWCWYWNNFW